MVIGLKQFRKDISSIIKSVGKGESITITQRGKPIAVINSFPQKENKEEFDSTGFGMWADRKDMEDVDAWVRVRRSTRYNQ